MLADKSSESGVLRFRGAASGVFPSFCFNISRRCRDLSIICWKNNILNDRYNYYKYSNPWKTITIIGL